jgi:hypothetical protein
MNGRSQPGFWKRPKIRAGVVVLLAFMIGIGTYHLFQVPGFFFNRLAPGNLLGSTLMGLLNILSTALTSCYAAIAMILYYYDIRVRKEGFDLKMLAQNL